MSGAHQAQDQPSSIGSDIWEGEGFSATFSTSAVWGSKVTVRYKLRSDKKSKESEESEDSDDSDDSDNSDEYHKSEEECFNHEADDQNSVLTSDASRGVQVNTSITNADRPQQYHNVNAAFNDLDIKDNCCLICRKRMREDGFSCPGGCGTLYHNDCVSHWRTPRDSENQEPCPCPRCGQDIFQEPCAVCGKPIKDYEFCCPQQCGAWLHEACVDRWVDQCRASHAGQNVPCPRCDAPWPGHTIPEETECPICFVAMDESLQNVTPCPALCKQNFHTQCINLWLESAEQNHRPKLCPMCRAPWS